MGYLQGSFRSSSTNILRASPSQNQSHRPFDLRFQSRLSSPPSRTSSPYLGYIHSRHSSLASQLSPGTVDSDVETPQGPWDVVRWTKLRKISGQAFSELGKRNFGHPTCMAVTTSIVIGTAKGVVLVFDYQQSLKAIIGTSTKGMFLRLSCSLWGYCADLQLLNVARLRLWLSLRTTRLSRLVMHLAISSPGKSPGLHVLSSISHLYRQTRSIPEHQMVIFRGLQSSISGS